MDENKPILCEMKNLCTAFRIKDDYFNAVENVNLSLYQNEVLAIVGESGCGKSTLATTIMGLHNFNFTKVSGEVIFEGKNILNSTEDEYNKIRGGKIGMIFQDPLSALNPLQRIGQQIEEGLIYHTKLNAEQRKERAFELLKRVGIEKPERIYKQFPHQLSGGMRQRVVIAIALSCKPKILIADEPTTALDVTIQAQVLDLMTDLKNKFRTSMLLITHDLGVVAQVCDKVAIMYAGEIVEYGSLEDVFENPKHPYTLGLFGSIPSLDEEKTRLVPIKGLMPDPTNLPTGCKFNPRCPHATELCSQRAPIVSEISKGHKVQCLIAEGLVKFKENWEEENE